MSLFRAHFWDPNPPAPPNYAAFLDQGLWWWPTFVKMTESPQMATHLTPLRDRLLMWGKRWHLEANWCLSTALRTLALWCIEPPADRTACDWNYGQQSLGEVIVHPDEQLFVFSHPGWELALFTREAAEADIRHAFERDLHAYLDRIEGLALQRGTVRTKEQRQPDHAAWLVRFQVLGQSQTEIARSLPESKAVHPRTKTVRDAINKLAALIDLPLRSVIKGRPRTRALS